MILRNVIVRWTTIVALTKAKEILKVVSLLMVCLGTPIIAWCLVRITRGDPVSNVPNPTYSELIGIILTAVTVVLAGLAIVIAILAVWGYKSIKDEAASAADRAVERRVDEAVKAHVSEDAMEKHFTKEVRRRLDLMLTDQGLYARAFEALGDNPQQGRVGTEYPREEGDDQRQADR